MDKDQLLIDTWDGILKDNQDINKLNYIQVAHIMCAVGRSFGRLTVISEACDYITKWARKNGVEEIGVAA